MAQKKQVPEKNTPAKKKALLKKASAKKTPAKNSASSARRSAPKQVRITTPEERHCLIAETAYLIAEQRGFQGDAALNDWLQAETDIDARLSAGFNSG